MNSLDIVTIAIATIISIVFSVSFIVDVTVGLFKLAVYVTLPPAVVLTISYIMWWKYTYGMLPGSSEYRGALLLAEWDAPRKEEKEGSTDGTANNSDDGSDAEQGNSAERREIGGRQKTPRVAKRGRQRLARHEDFCRYIGRVAKIRFPLMPGVATSPATRLSLHAHCAALIKEEKYSVRTDEVARVAKRAVYYALLPEVEDVEDIEFEASAAYQGRKRAYDAPLWSWFWNAQPEPLDL